MENANDKKEETPYAKPMMKFIYNTVYIYLIAFFMVLTNSAFADVSPPKQANQAQIVHETLSLFNEAPNGAKLLDKLQAFLTSDEISSIENIPGVTKGPQVITMSENENEIVIRQSTTKIEVHLKIVNQNNGEFSLNGHPWKFSPWLSPIENMHEIAKVINEEKAAQNSRAMSILVFASLFENSADAILGVDDAVVGAIYLMGAGLTFWGCGVQWLMDQGGMPVQNPDFDLSKVPGSCFGAAIGWPLLVGAEIYKLIIEPGLEKLGNRFASKGPAPKLDGLHCVFRTNKKTQQQVLVSVTAHYSNDYETILTNSPDGTHGVKVEYPNGFNRKTQRQDLAIYSQGRLDRNWQAMSGDATQNTASAKLLETSCENPMLRKQFGGIVEEQGEARSVIHSGNRAKSSTRQSNPAAQDGAANADAK